MRDALAWIDDTFPDTAEPIRPGDNRTHRWQRHLMFARYGLGESFTGDQAAFHIAHANRDEPLPLAAMRHIAANWHEAGEPHDSGRRPPDPDADQGHR